jgi:hypothetical protein
MKLTENQAFEIVRYIFDIQDLQYDEDELSDFVMLDLINKNFSEV